MRRTINIISIITGLIIIANIWCFLDLRNYKANANIDWNDAQSGIGIASIMILNWVVNTILCFILILITLIQGIRLKRISDYRTIILISALIGTLFLPWILMEYV